MVTDSKLVEIYNSRIGNAKLLESNSKDTFCGCYCCVKKIPLSRFTTKHIILERDGRHTLVCPECLSDTIIVPIPGKVGVTIELLEQLNSRYIANREKQIKQTI